MNSSVLLRRFAFALTLALPAFADAAPAAQVPAPAPAASSVAPASAQTPAGSVTMLTGRATASDADGRIRALIKGGVVYAGEIVNAGAASYVNLHFSDGGYVLLRPNSRFQIADFRNLPPAPAATAPAPAATPAAPAAAAAAPATIPSLASTVPGPGSRAFFRLLKGGFRAVSGLIGRVNHDDYEVATPVATIGIRGTDYIAVICEGTCVNDPVIVKALPAGASAQGGLVTGVKRGRIALGKHGHCPANPPAGQKTENDCVEVGEGQYHLTTADGEEIDLPEEPRFLHVDPMPDPQMCI
jgi:hypothetical protein